MITLLITICFYQSGNSNGFVIEPWFILAKVLGWHIGNLYKYT